MSLKNSNTAEVLPQSQQPAVGERKPDWGRTFGLREAGVYYALILLISILTFLTSYMGTSNYFTLLNMTNVVYQSSLVAIMAVAMTVVLISGNFDLSVASVAALAAALLIGFADMLGFWPAFAIAIVAAMVIGLVNGVIVQFVGINAFIVTLGTMTAVRGLVLLYTNGYALSATSPDVVAAMSAFEGTRINAAWVTSIIGTVLTTYGVFGTVRAATTGKAYQPALFGAIFGGAVLLFITWVSEGRLTLPAPVIYMLLFVAVVWFVLSFTLVGRRLYAVGSNPEAARLSGINVTKYKLMAFVLCSATAGFAGVLFASRLRSVAPSALTGYELTVIASAILGGTSLFGGAGSVVKTIAGAVLLFTLTNGFNILNLGANWQPLIQGIVIIVAAAIYTVSLGPGRRSPH